MDILNDSLLTTHKPTNKIQQEPWNYHQVRLLLKGLGFIHLLSLHKIQKFWKSVQSSFLSNASFLRNSIQVKSQIVLFFFFPVTIWNSFNFGTGVRHNIDQM